MQLKSIPITDLKTRVFDLFDAQWLLLCSGDFQNGQYNAMTISWGALGIMWNRPYAQVVVRPVRYTYEFMEHYDSFSLSAFPQEQHAALSLLGSRSGRDGDKIAESGLTPIASTRIAAPSFAEAALVFECRKMYWQDLDPAHFLDAEIEKNYPRKDYHRMYFGEIVAVLEAGEQV